MCLTVVHRLATVFLWGLSSTGGDCLCCSEELRLAAVSCERWAASCMCAFMLACRGMWFLCREHVLACIALCSRLPWWCLCCQATAMCMCAKRCLGAYLCALPAGGACGARLPAACTIRTELLELVCCFGVL